MSRTEKSAKTKATSDVAVFKKRLSTYKQMIDEDIATYAKHVRHATLQQYGAPARLETDAYLSILERGGKRIRGALVLLGYEMSGGTDLEMVRQAARAIEMIHAYILIIDDIQDRSDLRRGGPAAHKQLAQFHTEQHLAGGAEHFGMSMAINSALTGNHVAQMVLANLDTSEDLRLKVVSIMNRTMMVTVHGQSYDIMNEVTGQVAADDIERVMNWKTAQYTVLNPLHVGMVLAGADCHATDGITPFAVHTGMAFQIRDDILGTFGSKAETGKDIMSDIREGKQTVLSVYALEHAKSSDRNFLISMLGNQDLKPLEFERCKAILEDSGALKHAQAELERHVQSALEALEPEAHRWTPEGVQFLRGFARYLQS